MPNQSQRLKSVSGQNDAKVSSLLSSSQPFRIGPTLSFAAPEDRQQLLAGRDVLRGAHVAVRLVPEGDGRGLVVRRQPRGGLLGDGVVPAVHRARHVAAHLVGDDREHAGRVGLLDEVELAGGAAGQVGEDAAGTQAGADLLHALAPETGRRAHADQRGAGGGDGADAGPGERGLGRGREHRGGTQGAGGAHSGAPEHAQRATTIHLRCARHGRKCHLGDGPTHNWGEDAVCRPARIPRIR